MGTMEFLIGGSHPLKLSAICYQFHDKDDNKIINGDLC